MKDTYEMFENNNRIRYSYSIEKLINFTSIDRTKNAEIYYNGVLVWKQNP